MSDDDAFMTGLTLNVDGKRVRFYDGFRNGEIHPLYYGSIDEEQFDQEPWSSHLNASNQSALLLSFSAAALST
jgi:hypothetical protein